VGPLWPYIILIGLPAALFIVPDLWGGHLLMNGDNVQQNYPLHVLVGSMLRHGQLPLWDQYIYSGTPLLTGFNAGAFYPLMGFFVIFPDRVAWIALEVVLFAGIAVGMYLFLRALALSTVACLLAALTFTFSGTVFSQINHVDMTEGLVAVPWMLLAVLHIIRDGRWRWSVLLGVGFALVILGGAPEAMLDTAILVVLFAGFTAGLDRSRWWRVLTRGGAGAALALALGAIQWLPGLATIANSQRSGFGGSFAALGSYPRPDGLLTLVPYLYGGYGHLGEAQFFANYNLPEVGIYLGILPIVALLALWLPSWPSRLVPRDRLTWYLVALVGVLLALGANTPLEHLFNALPLYGHQRLQSRNMIDFSFAACVLFAGWIDRRQEAEDRWVSFDRWTGLIPLGIVLTLVALAAFDPDAMLSALTGAPANSSTVHTVRQASLIAAGFCLAAWVVVWLRPRLPGRWWLPVMACFVAADLGLAGAVGELSTPPPNDLVAGTTPVENYIGANLAPGGRYLLYDPQYFMGGSRLGNGLPDVNIMAGLPSVGGYSSIVDKTYNNATQTHTAGEFNVSELNSGALHDLGLQDILTVPEYFLQPLQRQPRSLAGVQPVSESAGQDAVLPEGAQPGYHDPFYAFYPPPRGPQQAGQIGTWFFGESLTASAASLVFSTPATPATLRFGSVGARGTVTWGPSVDTTPGARRVNGTLPPGPASGLAVQVESGQVPAHQAVVTVAHQPYELDGALSSAVRPGVWRQQGAIEGNALFVRNRAPTPMYAVTGGGKTAPPVTVLSTSPNTEQIRVDAPSALTVVRQVAWDDDWTASVSVHGGPARPAPMSAFGLVQQVRLPAGDDVVTFRYRPARFVVSGVLSAAATLLLVVLLVVSVVRLLRRRRRSKGGGGGVPAPA
jgi:hypothetical protein